MMINRVTISEKALQFIDMLKNKHGKLMFHQSGGCCDGSAPMCYEWGDFKIGDHDIWLGNVADCPYFIGKDQFEYWKHTQLELDITEGRGSSFSIEIPYGFRFLIRSRIFHDEELNNLSPTVTGEEYQKMY